MGQAKQRGSREQRVAVAQGLVERSLADIRQQLGLPDTAKFLGYGIHLEERDEFLAFLKDTAASTQKAWTDNPVDALTYGNYADAFEDAKKCPGSMIVGMFDLGDQIYVAQVGGKPA